MQTETQIQMTQRIPAPFHNLDNLVLTQVGAATERKHSQCGGKMGRKSETPRQAVINEGFSLEGREYR